MDKELSSDDELRTELIGDYEVELEVAKQALEDCMKSQFRYNGNKLQREVDKWAAGLAALKAGADPHKYNY